MARSWSPCRTEAKASKALQDTQLSQRKWEVCEEKTLRTTDRSALPGAVGRQILRSQQAHAGSGSFLQRPTREKDYATE